MDEMGFVHYQWTSRSEPGLSTQALKWQRTAGRRRATGGGGGARRGGARGVVTVAAHQGGRSDLAGGGCDKRGVRSRAVSARASPTVEVLRTLRTQARCGRLSGGR